MTATLNEPNGADSNSGRQPGDSAGNESAPGHDDLSPGAASGHRTPGDDAASWWTRPLVIALVLVVAYMGLARTTDPRAYLSTDTGGKTATLEAMTERGDLDPDLGYWASELDPDGSLYPMFSTRRFEDSANPGEGRWVNVTTLPMIYLALPLYKQWGYDGALLIPMVGAALAALAAGALARRVGAARRDAALVTWLVGLASPVVVYALDFWEHTLGLALIAWAVIAATDVVERAKSERASWLRHVVLPATLAGIGFGAASSMRQEALVFGFVTGLVMTAMLAAGRRFGQMLIAGGSMVVATVAAIAANAALESAVLGASSRTGRSAQTASALGSDLALRLEEAVITAAMPFGVGTPAGYLMAALLVGGLAWLAIALRDGTDPRPAALAVGAVYLMLALDMASSRSFVPGMIAVAPFAGIGLVIGPKLPAARLPYLVAVGSLPLVWLVQYTGGAGPQWGGRYILASGLLLTVLGFVALRTRQPALMHATYESRTVAVKGLSVAAALVAVIGVVWTAERTHGLGEAMAEVAASEEPILVFSDPFLSREAGPLAVEGQWLAAYTDELRSEAGELVAATDATEFGYVQHERFEVPAFTGWEYEGERFVEIFDGYRLRIATFSR